MKKYILSNRGFTLIELLVVIAIIGILAAVVLASLNTARAKGADAAIKSNINSMRAQAELYFDNNGSTYDPGNAGSAGGWVCADPNVVQAQTSVTSAGGVFSCSANSTAYRISSSLKTSATTYYCIDSTGKSYQGTTAPTGDACP